MPHVRSTWQRSGEGRICVWPGYVALLPTQNKIFTKLGVAAELFDDI